MKNYITDNRADYAEMFEATQEFSSKKIPRGTSVVLVGDKIRPAIGNDVPFGVISSFPIMLGNNGGMEWVGKYIKDEFGNVIQEESDIWVLDKVALINSKKSEAIEKVSKEHSKKNPSKKNIDKIIASFKEEIAAIKSMPVRKFGLISDGNIPDGAILRKKVIPKINPDFDENKKFIPRLDRPEWNMVGLIGKVKILKGQPVAPNWIKMKEVSDSVDEWLIR